MASWLAALTILWWLTWPYEPYGLPESATSNRCLEEAVAAPPCDNQPDSQLGGHEQAEDELVAAGILIMAGGGNGKPLDYDELERWTRVGYERGMGSRKGER